MLYVSRSITLPFPQVLHWNFLSSVCVGKWRIKVYWWVNSLEPKSQVVIGSTDYFKVQFQWFFTHYCRNGIKDIESENDNVLKLQCSYNFYKNNFRTTKFHFCLLLFLYYEIQKTFLKQVYWEFPIFLSLQFENEEMFVTSTHHHFTFSFDGTVISTIAR